MRIVLMLALAAPLLAHAGEWVNISDAVTSTLKPIKGGPTADVVVDRVSGDVFMVPNGQGLWKSTDHGATFAPLDNANLDVGGFCGTAWALQADPNGRRLFCFMNFGSSAMTTDGGKTWTKSATSDLDFGAVDWADSGKRVLAIRHGNAGALATSDDGGATWIDEGKGFGRCGVFDRSTFVVTRANERGIFRSGDAGATWARVSNDTPAAAVPVIFKGAGYWPAGKGILASKDKGLTWTWLGAPVDASFGPYFGESELHFVVVGRSGFLETKDGGKSFLPAAPLPPGFGINPVGPSYAWDPNADIFYASMMTKPTYKLQR
jgi:photosystem II stability/assembly factor-like uncharacterized protein